MIEIKKDPLGAEFKESIRKRFPDPSWSDAYSGNRIPEVVMLVFGNAGREFRYNPRSTVTGLIGTGVVIAVLAGVCSKLPPLP